MGAINWLKKSSFLWYSIGFAMLGVLSANVFLTYLKFSIPYESANLAKINPINLNLNLLKIGATEDITITKLPNDLDKLPNIDFQMRLLGSIITEKEDLSVVIIEYDGKEKTLSLNDALANNLVLIKILPNRLVFDNGGKKQKFDWQEDENKTLTFNLEHSQASVATPNNFATSENAIVNSKDIPLQKPLTVTTKQMATDVKILTVDKGKKIQKASTAPLVEKFGTDYRSKLLKNPFQLAKYVRLSPVRRDSRLIGYAVYPASDKSLFTAFGLEAGDILLSVNQIPTNNPGRMGDLMATLSEANVLDIDIERKGNQITINLPL